MNRPLMILLVGVLVASASIATPIASAQTPEASTPEGPIGEQLAWVLDLLNGDPDQITADRVESQFSPEFLAQAPAELLAASLSDFVRQFQPFTVEDGSLVASEDVPPTAAQVVLVGSGGTRFLMAVVIDPKTGLIDAFGIQPAPTAATPVASPVSAASTEDAVTFQSDGDTIHGSVMTPTGAVDPGYGALIISGSGPTDRNGNSGSLTVMNTNLNVATALADSGVTSLRYDKLGSGETGLANRTDPSGITVSLFLQEARDAASFLLQQPTVDSGKLILVGHSEGALFALMLAEEMTKAGTPPAGVILVSPLSIRYLDLLQEQVTTQYAGAVAAGAISPDEADAAVAELAGIVESIRSTGTLPDPVQTPALASLFTDSNLAFLAEIDRWDPAEIAAGLPSDLPVLVIHGGKDEQVTASQVASLMEGFSAAGNASVTLVEIPDANHLLKIVEGEPNAVVDYSNPNFLFAPAAVAALNEFVAGLDVSPASNAIYQDGHANLTAWFEGRPIRNRVNYYT